ncbi:MAG: DUF6531 domain-containing protein [Bacteroidales bacterium]|nr:DUF6531 domain-containing protein [Bacteroidales bacterium]
MNKIKYNYTGQIITLALFTSFFFAISVSALAQDHVKPKVPVFNNLEVNTFNGNLFYIRQDFLVKGIMPINVSFYYNSVSDTVDYGYGLGWFFHYGLNYYFDEYDNIVIIRSGGRKDIYNTDGSQYYPPVGIYDQLEEYEAQKFVLTTKGGLKYYFDDPSHKKLTGVTDLNGNTIIITYNSGHPATITNSSGRSVTMNWANDHLTEIVYENATCTYSYQDDFLYEVTNPLNFTETYQHLASGKLAAITDFRNSPVYIEYNSDIVVKKIKSCDSEIAFTFTENKSYIIENGNSGKLITCYTYDGQDRVAQITNPDKNSINFEYDNNNNIITFTDFKGNATNLTYDNRGNIISETNAAGYTNQATYNQFNKIETSTDRKGNTTTFNYDGNGNLLSIDQPLEVSNGFTYDGFGNITQSTNPNDVPTSYTYDENHNLTQIDYPIGYVALNYDGLGNITDLTDANNNSLFFEYDEKDRLTKVKVNDTIETNYTYDGNGNIGTETDANGNVKSYGYDSQNRLIYVAIPAGVTNYEYDQQNNLTKIADANGNITEYFYNSINQLILEVDPIGNQVTYEYDENGNLTYVTDANSNTIQYTYNSLNQLTQRGYIGNTDHFSYDEEGNILNMYNNDINISFDYDALNRLTQKNVNTWNKVISYTYDLAGNRKTMTDPDGGVTYYNYDSTNRLTSLINPFTETTGFEYDDAGRITNQTNANGTYTDYSYNDWDLLTSLFNRKSNDDLISSYEYIYDSYGNRLTMLENETGLHQYTYDDSHRLTEVDYPDGDNEVFEYDGSGNRITHTLNGTETNYTYNEADQMLSAGNISFTYDNNGNTISKTESGQTAIYEYDGQNRLIRITFPDDTENVFTYDPFGNRISLKNILEQTTFYFHDGVNVLSELDNTGQSQARYTTSLGVDSWLSLRKNSQSYFYHKDGLNSTTSISDFSQSLTNSYSYNVFGEMKNQTGSVENPYKYTGREFDAENGLYYYRSRYYSERIGRFQSVDKFPGLLYHPFSLNSYCYVENNPVINTDPFGYSLRQFQQTYLNIISPDRLLIPLFSNKDTKTIVFSAVGILTASSSNPLALGMAVFYGTYSISTTLLNHIPYWPQSSTSFGKDLALLFDNPYLELLDYLPTIVSLLSGGLEYKDLDDEVLSQLPGTLDDLSNRWGNLYDILIELGVIRPIDPNEIIGSPGYDTAQWVSVNQNLAYTVLFENDHEFATAPAQNVHITVPIDSTLNMYDFRLSEFGFGSFVFQVPQNVASYSNRLDVRDSLGLYVDISAGLNVQNQEAFWLFESIDPITGLPPTDALAGFLPVNDSLLGNGEGFVTFTIKPKETDQTGDSLKAYAEIIFDENAPITTNTWVNVVDALPPVSTVDPLPPAMGTTSFDITFSGEDDTGGCGISKYQLYFSKDDDPYLLYGEYNPDTVIGFTGSANSTYKFFSRAKDHVGNIEAMKTVPDVVTTLSADTILVDLKVFLEGPFFNGQMTPFLNVLGYLPLDQPYNTQPWNYNGQESVFTIPSFNIIDWVLVELIQFTDSLNYTTVGQKAGFIDFNGVITDLDGISYLSVPVADTNDLYICLHHRNHLRVYSANPMSYSVGIYSYDFTVHPDQFIGGAHGAKELSSGIWGMLSGDANGDGQIDNKDKNDIWVVEVGLSGYYSGDLNMDTQVDPDDKVVKWEPNAGKGIHVPE